MKPDSKNLSPLPEELRKYFWDVAFEELSFEKYPRFISERILNYGNLDDIRWLLALTGRDFIKDIISSSRNINAKTKNFWQVVLS